MIDLLPFVRVSAEIPLTSQRVNAAEDALRSDGLVYYNVVLSVQLSKTFKYSLILFQQWLCAGLQYTDAWISVAVENLYQVHFQHCLLRQYGLIPMAPDYIDFNFVCVFFAGDIYCGFALDQLLISTSYKPTLSCRVH